MFSWISRALHRADQFKRAVFANVTSEEIQKISSVLTPEEISLFLKMSVVDQRHSLDVYYTSLKVIEDYPDADPELTSRAVLLHDLGKSRFHLSLLDRILATFPRKLVKTFFPWKYKHVTDYKDLHPGYSAEMIEDEQLAHWVQVHYQEVNEEDPPELKVLKISDYLN